jgi:predicted DNA-binding protein with PD1-like motif
MGGDTDMIIKKINHGNIFMGRLNQGADLLEELNKICWEKGIQLGQVQALGAVQKALIGYYDQESREYHFHTLNKPHEILSLVGNISLKDNKPMVHAHITLADEAGKACGGHLAPGTIIFACEYLIQSFKGEVYKRKLDDATGLPLWKS